MKKILFLHGYGARPGGYKPTFLRQRGYEVINPHLPDDDFEKSVHIAAAALANEPPDIVVGSSRGGAVAMNIEIGTLPLVLIAPAWKRWGTATKVGSRTLILHSTADDLIPVADSHELATRSDLPKDALILIGKDHYMGDEEALAALVAAIEKSLAG